MKRLSLTLILSGLCLLAFSQESLSLSVEEAQRYAWEHNRTLQNANIDIQIAERSKWQALATMLPQVSAALDYQNMCGYEMVFGVGGATMAIPLNPSGTLAATAAVALSGAQIVGVLINNVSIEMANISLEKTQQDITTSVSTIYASALTMEQTLDLLEQNMQNLTKLYEMTENSVKVGVSEQTDADQLSVQVASFKNNISSTKRSIELLYNSLRLQLGVPADTEISLTDNIDYFINDVENSNLLAQPFVIDNNLDYRLLEKNLSIAEKNVSLAWTDYLPTLSAYYQYNAKTYFGKEEGMNMTPPNMVGISISVPIWSSGQRTTKLQSAKLAYDQNKNIFADTKESLLIQDKQLRYDLMTAFDSYQIQDKNIEVTQRILTNISNKFEHGRASSMEVTNASTDLISAQGNYIQSVLTLVEAQLALKKLLNQ
ncbi:MAG: TolC family protein [Bacteroidales bacterium]|nr:TolC family protein [Bacteroidales bacterium]